MDIYRVWRQRNGELAVAKSAAKEQRDIYILPKRLEAFEYILKAPKDFVAITERQAIHQYINRKNECLKSLQIKARKIEKDVEQAKQLLP